MKVKQLFFLGVCFISWFLSLHIAENTYIYLWNRNQNLWTFVFFEFSILNLLALGGWGWFRECFVVGILRFSVCFVLKVCETMSPTLWNWVWQGSVHWSYDLDWLLWHYLRRIEFITHFTRPPSALWIEAASWSNSVRAEELVPYMDGFPYADSTLLLFRGVSQGLFCDFWKTVLTERWIIFRSVSIRCFFFISE